MIFPPCLLRVKIDSPKHHVNLWIPLFLVWIILGIPALVLSLVFLIVVLVSWYFEWGQVFLKGGLAVCGILCASRDLKIDVDRGQEKVFIYFK